MNSPAPALCPGAPVAIIGTGVAGWAAAAMLAQAGHQVCIAGDARPLAGPLPAEPATLHGLETLVGARLPGWWAADGLQLTDDWPSGHGLLALWQPAVLAETLRRLALAAGAQHGRVAAGAVAILAQPSPSAWRCWAGQARDGKPGWAIITQAGGMPTTLLARAPDDRLLLATTGTGTQPAAMLASLALAGGSRWAGAMGALALDPRPLPRPLGWQQPPRPGLMLPEPGPFGLAALVVRLEQLVQGRAPAVLLPEASPCLTLPEENDDANRLPDVAAAAAHRLWQR